MGVQAEFDTWRRQWQGVPSEAEAGRRAVELRRRVERQSRWYVAGLIVPVLVTVLIGGGVVLHAERTGKPGDVAVALETWLFIVMAWAASIWIARGTWRPLSETTAAFVDLSMRRCRANLRAIPLAVGLYLAQLVVLVLLKYRYGSAGAVVPSLPPVVLGGGGFLALLVGGRWYALKQHAKLRQLDELRRQLIEDVD